jgi:competence protein ComEA
VPSSAAGLDQPLYRARPVPPEPLPPAESHQADFSSPPLTPSPPSAPLASQGRTGAGGVTEGWPAPGGPPLTWNDLLPGWPDDVTLEPAAPSEAVATVPPVPAPEDLATRPPWAAAPVAQRPLAPPALFAPDPFEDDEDYPAEEDDQPLSGTGAFDSVPRSRFGAFDPGRRGVKALAVVAIVVVVIAALLAWRTRPRVDPVAPPGIDPAAADASLPDTPAADPKPGAPAVPAAKPSAPAAVVVAVGGKVRKPGLVELPPGSRVADALQAAGGANPGVDVAPLNLARKVADGELIMVGVTPPPGVAPTGPAGPAQPGAGPINLNTATLADLDTLPGVGPVLAQRILEAREAQGGFHAVSDLRQVSGIGTARYEQLKDLVTV